MPPSKRTANGTTTTTTAPQPWDSDSELPPEDLELSSSDDSDSDADGAAREADIEDAVLDYLRARRRHQGRSSADKTSLPSGKVNGTKDEEDDEDADEDDDEGEFSMSDFSSGSDSDEDSIRDGKGEEDQGDDDDVGVVVRNVDEQQRRDIENRIEDPGSDSSEDERPNRNTVGAVPLAWYKDEEHVGYDVQGQKLVKRGGRDKLDRLLARNDSAAEWRTVYDEYNDEEIVLSKEEMRMIQRIRTGKFPHAEIDPYEPENDWFSRETEVMALSGAPEPKRRFIPSKWEEKRVVKLVRAMRKGWLKKRDEAAENKENPAMYLMWQDDGTVVDKTQAGLTYIPAPKLKLPGHEESYNPPPEYIPTEEERNAATLEAEDEGLPPPFVPRAFDALRRVPAYSAFIRERFERCLDLYLCPRARIKRLDVKDPEALVPKLPKPKDLQPFPSVLALRFLGHKGAVRSLSTDPSGQWLLSGGEDGAVKLWEVRTGRCCTTWHYEDAITCVAWCPDANVSLAAIATGTKVVVLPLNRGNEDRQARSVAVLDAALESYAASTAAPAGGASGQGDKEGALAFWRPRGGTQETAPGAATVRSETTDGGIEIVHRFAVTRVTWHAKGDYFCTVSPSGNTRAVLVHQLSRGASQNPFRKNRGRVVDATFHPTKPFFFVATQQAVRVYNLAKQALAKKLITGGGVITSLDVHPSGDHLIVGSEDRRLAWYDLDLSPRPYRALRYHAHAVRGTAFHRTYPLFASASDDATSHVFHGMVYADMMTNPLIVPVKILRGHKRGKDARGVLDVVFHPTQPWLFTAGADAEIHLYANP